MRTFYRRVTHPVLMLSREPWVCECEPDGGCDGRQCDPSPDLPWMCSQWGCRMLEALDRLRSRPCWPGGPWLPAPIRPPLAHRASVDRRRIEEVATRAARDGDAQARQPGGLFG